MVVKQTGWRLVSCHDSLSLVINTLHLRSLEIYKVISSVTAADSSARTLIRFIHIAILYHVLRPDESYISRLII